MAVIIKRRNAPEMREAAPIVEGAPVIQAVEVVKPTEPTDAERFAAWQKYPAPNAKPKQCQWCMQMYIAPCSVAAQGAVCGNYLHMRAHGPKEKKK